VAVGVRISVENNEAIGAAMDDARLFVGLVDGIAEDTPRLLVRATDVGVTPRRPEIIHAGRVAEKSRERRAVLYATVSFSGPSSAR